MSSYYRSALKRVLTVLCVGVGFCLLMFLAEGISSLILYDRWYLWFPSWTPLPMPYTLFAVMLFALFGWYPAVLVHTVGCATGQVIGNWYGSLSKWNHGGMMTPAVGAASILLAVFVQLAYGYIKKRIARTKAP